MEIPFKSTALWLLGGALIPMANSCVDHDYDLTQDIDMTVKVGETLNIPASSTDDITLNQILDLESTSSIKTVEEGEYGLKAGDYVLLQEGDSKPATVTIQKVVIKDIEGNTTKTVLPPFISAQGDEIIVKADPSFNIVSLQDDDVTTELVSLDEVELDVDLNFNISYTSSDYYGVAYIKQGYTAEFDNTWTLRVEDAASAEYLEMVSHNVVRFKKDYAISPNSPMEAKLKLVNVDCKNLPAGQGLYAPGHFKLNSHMESNGDISIKTSDLAGVAHLDLVTTTTLSQAKIVAVTGIVDPVINVKPTSFAINDIPDFLSEPGNNLDVENPQIYVTVRNNSSLSLKINGLLTASFKNKPDKTIGIGDLHGTAEILAAGNATTRILISRRPTAISGVTNIVVEELGEIISSVPNEIVFHDVDLKAIRQTHSFVLGQSYEYESDYEAVIPLAFGSEMHLEYTKEEKDWDEDLDKYNFNQIQITTKVDNTVPLDLTPEVVALDHQGNDIANVTAEIEGMVAAGSIEQPSSSELKIVLRSSANNLGQLDGVRLFFKGEANPQFVGVNLNKDQKLKFNEIKLTILGGVIIDLND